MSSGITYMTSAERHRPILLTFLQLFNLRIIYEVYVAMKKGRETFELVEIRMNEAIFEATPITVLLLYFYGDYYINGDLSQIILISISVFLSVFTLARMLNYTDIYGLAGKARKSFYYRVLLAVWRITEILFRFALWALFSTNNSNRARGLFW